MPINKVKKLITNASVSPAFSQFNAEPAQSFVKIPQRPIFIWENRFWRLTDSRLGQGQR